MARKSAIAGEYVIERADNGSITVYKIYDNTKEGLREAAKQEGFEVDETWNTRTFGAKLIDFVNEKKG